MTPYHTRVPLATRLGLAEWKRREHLVWYHTTDRDSFFGAEKLR